MWNIDRCLQGPKCFWDMSWGTQGPRELSSWRVGGRKGAVDRCHDESSSHSYWWWTDLGRPVERGCNRIRQLLYIASLYDKGTTLACKFLHKERFFHWYLQQDKTKEIWTMQDQSLDWWQCISSSIAISRANIEHLQCCKFGALCWWCFSCPIVNVESDVNSRASSS